MPVIKKEITPVTEIILASVLKDIFTIGILFPMVGVVVLLILGLSILSIPIALLILTVIYATYKYRKYKQVVESKAIEIATNFVQQKTVDFMVAIVIRHIGSEYTGSVTAIGVPESGIRFANLEVETSCLDDIVNFMLQEYNKGTKLVVPSIYEARDWVVNTLPDVKLNYTSGILRFVVIRVFLNNGKYIPFVVNNIPIDIKNVISAKEEELQNAKLEIPDNWSVPVDVDLDMYETINK